MVKRAVREPWAPLHAPGKKRSRPTGNESTDGPGPRSDAAVARHLFLGSVALAQRSFGKGALLSRRSLETCLSPGVGALLAPRLVGAPGGRGAAAALALLTEVAEGSPSLAASVAALCHLLRLQEGQHAALDRLATTVAGPGAAPADAEAVRKLAAGVKVASIVLLRLKAALEGGSGGSGEAHDAGALALLLELAMEAIGRLLRSPPGAAGRAELDGLREGGCIRALAEAAVLAWRADEDGSAKCAALVQLLATLDREWWKHATVLWWSRPRLLRNAAVSSSPPGGPTSRA